MIILNTLSDSRLLKLISDSSVGILPTDTIYGLVGGAADQAAVKRLYGLKGRESKPGTVIAANPEQLVGLGLKYRYVKAVEHLWPNPLSIVLPCDDELSYLHLGLYGLAVRIPADKKLRQLLSKTGPLLTTSVNRPGKPAASTIGEAQKYFGDKVDFYVNGGDLKGHKPSNVIRVIDDAIEILRPGAVNIDETGKIKP
jgi:L-threonylcarbamoyladenylate synthase